MSETIYIGRANRIKRELTRNGAELSAVDQAAITKVQVIIQGQCFDTEAHPGEIQYDDGVFTLQAGLREGLAAADRIDAHIVVYDPANTEGLAWGTFRVTIKAWPECNG